MPPLSIHVNGNASRSLRPERAQLSLEVRSESISQASVSHDVKSTSNSIQALIKELSSPKPSTSTSTSTSTFTPDTSITNSPTDTATDANTATNAPITHWSTSTIYSNSYMTYDAKGGPQERRYVASTTFSITFVDFSALGQLANTLLSTPFVTIRDVTWELTSTTLNNLGSQMRRDAVRDAILKATDLAEAAGRGQPRAVEIRHEGDHSNAFRAYHRSAMHAAQEEEQQSLSFEPEDVKVSAGVSVNFEAE